MNIFLCDDEFICRKIYSEIIKTLCKKYSIECHIKCFSDGLHLISEMSKAISSLGIVFLDIRMPKIDGLTVAKKISSLNPNVKIIFLTASKNYILQAFDLGAFNYLIKNQNDDTRFERVFLKALNSIRKEEEKHILLSNARENRSIPVNDIMYFEILKRIITVHYDHESFEFFSTLSEIENKLSDKNFVRIHRSFIVSIPCIESISYTHLKLRDGTVLPIGRTYLDNVRTAFNRFYN